MSPHVQPEILLVVRDIHEVRELLVGHLPYFGVFAKEDRFGGLHEFVRCVLHSGKSLPVDLEFLGEDRPGEGRAEGSGDQEDGHKDQTNHGFSESIVLAFLAVERVDGKRQLADAQIPILVLVELERMRSDRLRDICDLDGSVTTFVIA